MLSDATRHLDGLADDLGELRARVLAAEGDDEGRLEGLEGDARASAINLLQYLVFRAHDIRPLQEALAELGLSSLGRSEGHVAPSLDAVTAHVARLCGRAGAPPAAIDLDAGRRLLRHRADVLLGRTPRGRPTRIMVTLPGRAAGEPELVREMAAAGMDVARINLAHDDAEAWSTMAGHVRAQRRPDGTPCRVLMDLPGPKCRTGPVPEGQSLKLGTGDRVTLVREGPPSREPVTIACTLGLAFARVRRGDRVFLDDGKFAGIVEDADRDRLEVRITRAGRGRAKLKPEKGVNFPDTDLSDAALPESDLALIREIGHLADVVGLSFVSRPEDVARAREELDRHGAAAAGLLLKIETPQGFERLPDLLLAGLRTGRPVGVMIARGDLAVEVGVERLAEVQEEVLWLCEAAHVPAVWATQVLEAQAKAGFPSRAEITDAAMGSRAECVMLNKGPRIIDAITTLDSILRRMADHQDKKTPLLRRLAAWD